MATKAAAKKAKKRAPAGKQNRTPALDCPRIADFRTPHSTESSGRKATALVTFAARKAAWTAAVRKHFADGGAKKDLPVFDPKHFPDPNSGIQSQAAYEKQVDRWNKDDEVEFGPRYNPVLVDLVCEMNASCLRRGSKLTRPPSGYDEKVWGSWYLVGEDGERTVPSGWFFDKKPRRCHAKRAEELVTEPEKNILTFGQNRYVVGDGTNVRSGPMLVWATSRGNYRAGDDARKRMSLAGNKDATDVVFRIEDRSNNGDGVTVKANWNDIQEVVFMPGQALTAGFLFNEKGERLTAKDIRGLDPKTTGLKFKTVRQALDGPIVGKAIPWDKLWVEIQRIEGKAGIKKLREREGRSESDEVDQTPQKRSKTNIRTTMRIAPNEAFPFAFRAVECDMVPYIVNEADGSFSMGIVVGDRSNFEYNVGVHQAKAEEVKEVEEAPKPTKSKAAKGKKGKAAKKAKPADAAPPVEHDTAEEPEAAEEETADATA
jgi:hypothetical protein